MSNFSCKPCFDFTTEAFSFASSAIDPLRIHKDPTQILELSKDELDWKEQDAKVSSYPIVRLFSAVGTGGDAFILDVAQIVSNILNVEITSDQVFSRTSSKGNYTSARIGPIQVNTPEQVILIFRAFKSDKRVKWCS
mmetsp:Transcript_22470/g.39862  ORF Transcript_22470/g.39862 Transcript_22470/m.39862 type:complete len:137 (+) Transcript_22470:64-474(+)